MVLSQSLGYLCDRRSERNLCIRVEKPEKNYVVVVVVVVEGKQKCGGGAGRRETIEI